MKKEPWVRFGIRISPKISENPADSRKSRPPSVTLLTASTSQRLIERIGGGSALERRIVPRVDRLGEEPLLDVGPELAHLRVRLDRGVDELVALALAAPDVEVADHVAEMIEGERPAGRVGERHRAQRPIHRLAVVGLAARLLHRGLRNLAVDVEAGRVEPGNVAVVADHPVDQALVARGVEVAGVSRAGDQTDRLVAVALEQRIVTGRPAAQDGELET